MFRVRKHSWERLSHWLLSSQLSSISSLGAKTARDTLPGHTALWEKSGRGSLGLNTNTEEKRKHDFPTVVQEILKQEPSCPMGHMKSVLFHGNL